MKHLMVCIRNCSVIGKRYRAAKFYLLQEFFNFKYDGWSDMNPFFSSLQNIAAKLKYLDKNIEDNMVNDLSTVLYFQNNTIILLQNMIQHLKVSIR